MENIGWVNLCLCGKWLGGKDALQVFLEIMALKMAGDILFAMSCVCLIRGQEVLMVTGVDDAREGMIELFGIFNDRRLSH